jgi:hypothetical protein
MTELHSGNPQLPEQTRLIMRALEAKNGDSFQTHYFRKQVEGVDEALAWREAWCNPISGAWEVTEHATVPDFSPEAKAGAQAERRKTIQRQACFFDALYHCAVFEASERRFGNSPAGEKTETAHYMDFAAAEGIPMDKTGMPLLAAYGRILTDGDYGREAREIAKKSPKKLKVPEKPALTTFGDLAPAAVNLPAVIDASYDLTIESQQARAKIRAMAGSILAKMDMVGQRLQACRESNFVWCRDTSLFWAPLIPVIGQIALIAYAKHIPGDFPRRQFRKAVQKLQTEAREAAPSFDVAPVNQYAADAALAFRILWARQAARDFIARKGSEKSLNKCIEAFAAAARQESWNENKIADMSWQIRTCSADDSIDDSISSKLAASGRQVAKYLRQQGREPGRP